jgi:small conductance mechanosensitive channel
MENFLTELVRWLETNGLALLLTAAVGFVTYHFGGGIVYKVVYRIIFESKRRTWPKKDVEKRANTLASLVKAIFKIVLLVIIVGVVVHILVPSVNLGAIVAGLGVMSVAIGFGAQSLVKDFITGLFIISENQYRVGDKVDLGGGAIGHVIEIGARSTVLRDEKDNIHFVPNGSVSHVVNSSLHHQFDKDE